MTRSIRTRPIRTGSMLRALGGTIALTALLPGLAVAQTIPVPPPAIETQPSTQFELQPVPPTAPIPSRSTDTPGFSQSEPAPAPQSQTQQPTIACPAGQFASRFSDVTPNDWAFDAVNRIAIGELRCFPTQS